MTWFVILAAALVAGALLLVVPPMLGLGARRRAQVAHQRQAETALAVLREQRADLEAERAAGHIGEAEYARAQRELEQRALEEGQAVEEGADLRPSRLAALGLVLCVPLASAAVYLAVGEPDGLDPAAAVAPHAQRGGGEELTPERLAALVEQLAQRLEANPADETGWAMLARSYLMLGDVEGGARTWSRIGDLAPDNAAILADWADILVSAENGEFSAESRAMLERALELDPEQFKALALSGAAAYQAEDFAGASGYWERILDLIPANDPAFESVVGSINEARSRGGMEPFVPADAPAAPPAAAELSLTGQVSVAPELTDALTDDSVVFVFIRAPEGGLPFAAIRLPAQELPAYFDFAGAQRMNEAPLPERVVVVARVSASGDPMPQAGDLEGESDLIDPHADELTLVIDRVRE